MHGEPILRFERVRVTFSLICLSSEVSNCKRAAWHADMSCSLFFLLTGASDCCSLGFLAASICDNLLIQNHLYLGSSLLSIRPKYHYNNTYLPSSIASMFSLTFGEGRLILLDILFQLLILTPLRYIAYVHDEAWQQNGEPCLQVQI